MRTISTDELNQFCIDASNGDIKLSHYNSHINLWRNTNKTLCFIDIYPIYNDRVEIVKSEVLHNPNFIEHASDTLKDIMEIVKMAVSVNGLTLEFASKRLQDNENIVKIAVKQNPLALQFASERLQRQPANISKLVNNSILNENFFITLNPRIKILMKNFIPRIIKKWDQYENLPIDLRQDKRIAEAAVKKFYDNFRHVPEKLKANQSIINAMIQGNLRYRSSVLSHLKPIIMMKVLFFKELTEVEKNNFIEFIKQHPDFLEAINDNVKLLMHNYITRYLHKNQKCILRFNWPSFKAIAGEATMNYFRAAPNNAKRISLLMTRGAKIIQQNKAEIECRIQSFSSYAEACTAAASGHTFASASSSPAAKHASAKPESNNGASSCLVGNSANRHLTSHQLNLLNSYTAYFVSHGITREVAAGFANEALRKAKMHVNELTKKTDSSCRKRPRSPSS